MKHYFLTLAALLMAAGLWGQREAFKELLDESGKNLGGKYIITHFEDSIAIKRGYETEPGGILKITPARYATYHDTVIVHHPWVSNDETYGKLIALEKSHPPRFRRSSHSTMMVVIPDSEECYPDNKSRHYEFAYVEISPISSIPYTDYQIKEGYEEDFPKGLMEVHLPLKYQVLIAPARYEWLPLEEWDSLGKTLVPDFHSTFEDGDGYRYLVLQEGVYSGLRGLYCCGRRNSASIGDIQNTLKQKGYDVPLNNILGEKTKAALTHFQKTHGLPVGNLNMETLKALGLQY